MSSPRSSFPWARIFFFLILILAIAAIFILPRWWVEVQLSKLPPDVLEIIERFRSEPVEIPEGWVTPPGAPEDLLALVEEHQATLEEPPPLIPQELVSKALAGVEISDSEWEEVASILSAAERRIRASMELASHPDYWFGAYPKKVGKQGIPDYLPIQSLGHYLPLLASLQTHQGNFEEAFETHLSLLRLSVRRPSDPLIDHLIGLALTNSAIHPMTVAANGCDDVELLKQTLDKLNELTPRIQLGHYDDPVLASVLEWIHYERKNGGAIDVSPDMTGFDYLRAISSPTSATSRKRRKSVNQPAAGWFQNINHLWATLTGTDQILLAVSIPNLLESRVREESIESQFDLLRLTLAGRIHELETGEKANDQDAFIPDLWEDPLPDPFTEKPFLWDASSEVFYSVAPDEVDDGNRITYAPTNGTTSVGDFSLR